MKFDKRNLHRIKFYELIVLYFHAYAMYESCIKTHIADSLMRCVCGTVVSYSAVRARDEGSNPTRDLLKIFLVFVL